MYDILAVHGIIVFILSLILIWNRLMMVMKTEDVDRGKKAVAVSAIFAIFIESFIDMDLMWADYSPLLLFLFLTVFAFPERGKADSGG